MLTLAAPALVLLALLGFTLYCRYCRYGRLLNKIPGPPRWPLIGNAHQTMFLNGESGFVLLRDLHKTYGPISKMTSLLVSIVHISSAEYAEKLLSTPRFNEKRVPYSFMRSWLCEGLLTSNGSKWHQRRKLLTPSFHFSILKGFCSTFNEQESKFLEVIEMEAKKECSNIMPIVARTTLNVMCETSMGTSVNKADTEQIIDKYFNSLLLFGNIIQTRIVSIWLHFDWVHKLLPMARKEKKIVSDMHELTNQVIQNRKYLRQNIKNNNTTETNDIEFNKKNRLALLDMLLELEEKGDIDDAGIREEVDTFMFEGHDTTATVLGFMIMRIANETKIQEKIFEEQKQIFGDSRRQPTVDDLFKMNYLERCIKESLRLYPSVSLIARYISEDVLLGEYTVPKGATAFIHVFDIHHDPKVYPDPERFDPDRFLPENCVRRHPYAYIPFSAGPRNCIGQKFAMYELKTMMSGLLRRFRLEPVTKPEDVIFNTDLVLRTRDPLFVKFRKR